MKRSSLNCRYRVGWKLDSHRSTTLQIRGVNTQLNIPNIATHVFILVCSYVTPTDAQCRVRFINFVDIGTLLNDRTTVVIICYISVSIRMTTWNWYSVAVLPCCITIRSRKAPRDQQGEDNVADWHECIKIAWLFFHYLSYPLLSLSRQCRIAFCYYVISGR